MRRFLAVWVVVWLFGGAAVALAGSSLTLRLVEASNQGKGMGPGLGDVADLLRGNMPFTSYQLTATRTVPLPSDSPIAIGAGLVVRCSGKQSNLQIKVTRDGRPVLESTVELQDNTPLVLGGFPTAGGKSLLILLAH